MIVGIVEHDRGELNEASLEMLTVARGVAEKQDTHLGALLVGEKSRPLAEGLSAYGVSDVYVAAAEDLGDYAPLAWAESVLALMEDNDVEAVLASGTDRGHEVLAHIAARADLPMAANCLEIEPGDAYQVTRQRWGGSLLEEAELEGPTKLLSVALHLIPAEEAPLQGEIQVHDLQPDFSDGAFRVRVISREETEEAGVSLSDARVVIGGGRGVGSAEDFDILEELAGQLGGAVGGSRVATNNGWRPHSDQIGQTGNRIAPDIYIACGISGAIQHMVGCQGAKNILAINTDPEAPIMEKADYAVVGDLHEVVPAITEEIKKR